MKIVKQVSRIVLAITVSLGLVLASWACAKSTSSTSSTVTSTATSTATATGKVIKVGFAADFTGPAASSCGPITQAAFAYFDYVNAELGGINGNPVQVLWADDQYNVQQALDAYKRFAQQGILAFNECSSGGMAAVKPFLAQDKIPAFTISVDDSAVYPPGNTWMIGPTYSDMYAGLIKYVKDNWKGTTPPKLGFLTWDNPLGRGSQTPEAIAYAKSLGYQLVDPVYIPVAPTNVTSELLKLDAAGVNVIYSGVAGAAEAVILKNAQQLGLVGKIQFLGARPTIQPDLITGAGAAAAEGYMFSDVTDIYAPLVPGAVLYQRILQQYKGMAMVGNPGAYVDGLVMYTAIKRALDSGVPVSKLDGQAVIDKGLVGLSVPDGFGGLLPPIAIGNGQDRRATMSQKIFAVKGGQYVKLTDWVKCPDMAPAGFTR